eukprot:5901304-Amphidinium_carterae.1
MCLSDVVRLSSDVTLVASKLQAAMLATSGDAKELAHCSASTPILNLQYPPLFTDLWVPKRVRKLISSPQNA